MVVAIAPKNKICEDFMVSEESEIIEADQSSRESTWKMIQRSSFLDSYSLIYSDRTPISHLPTG
jgi:hypothetical protein